MKYEIIGSSSKGNCIIVEDFLMLDCGVSYKSIKDKLSKIKLIFISHSHSDHLNKKTIKQIAYNYPTIKFIVKSKNVICALALLNVDKRNIYVFKTNNWYKFESIGLEIKFSPLFHDVENYALHWKYKDKKGLYVVDTNRIDHINAKNYDLYLIESNYKEDILQKHIDDVSRETIGDLVYLTRVPETHLSYEKANDFLINNMGENSRFDYLHQSEYNFEKEEI